MAEYRLAPRAKRDIEAIWQYTAEQWGVEQADHYYDLLVAAFEKLAASPNLAAACDDIRPGYRRGSVESHHVYFRATDYGIAIMRVLHAQMAQERHI